MKKKPSKNHKAPKAPLSWNLSDFFEYGEEPPACVVSGKTEGELMEQKDIEIWTDESLKSLSIIKEEYPSRFAELYSQYTLDLDYLESLGKITKEEKDILRKSEIFCFGQEE